MILSGETIKRLGILYPCNERTIHTSGLTYGLSHCGYDIRVAQDVSFFEYRFTLASSVEQFTIPDDVMGVVHDKSTWARQGLSVFNTVIEPGWKGYLTLELVNHYNIVTIKAGTPIAQVVFHQVDEKVPGYKGKYQNQPNQPIQARFDDCLGSFE